MAATPRPDGLFDVTLDNGQTTAMNLTQEQLLGMGHEIMPAPGMSPQATAFNGGAGGASGSVADVSAPVPGAGGASQMPPQGMAATSMTQPTDQPGGMPPTRSAVFADIQANPNLSQAEKEKQIADITEAQPTGSSSSAAAPSDKVDPKDLDMSGGGGAAGGYGARPSPVRRIPGKDVRASYTKRPGQELPDDIKSEFESDNRPEDFQARANTIADLRNAQQMEREGYLMERQKALDVERAKRADIDKRLGEKQQLISQREQEAEKLSPRNAKEVMRDKGAIGQMMAVISMALGGRLQGLQGRGSNPGADQINQIIQSDVQGERQKYEDALARGETARNDYAKAVELYGSPEAAEQDLTMRRLAIAEKMVENHAQQIGTQEYLQAAGQEVQGLRQKRAETKQRLFEYEHGQVIQENYVRTADQYVGGTPQIKPDDRKRAVRLPNGEFVFARSEDTAKKAQDQIKVDTRIAEASERVKYLRSLPGAKTDPAIRGQIQAAAADLFISLKSGANLGTLDKGSLDFREEWTGDAAAIVDLGGADAKLSEVGKAALGRVQDTVRYDLHSDPNSLAPAAAARPPTRPNE